MIILINIIWNIEDLQKICSPVGPNSSCCIFRQSLPAVSVPCPGPCRGLPPPPCWTARWRPGRRTCWFWSGRTSYSLNSARLTVKFVLFLSLNYVWALLSHFLAPRKSFIHFTMQWWLRNLSYALSLDLAKISAALDPNSNIIVFSVAASLECRQRRRHSQLPHVGQAEERQ